MDRRRRTRPPHRDFAPPLVTSPTFRLCTPADREGVLALFHAAFPRLRFSREWWNWFATGPTRTYLALFEDGTVIGGAFSLIDYPQFQLSREFAMKCALGANLCLAPQYQRRARTGGVSHFHSLCAHVCAAETARGTEGILVVPNANSTGGLRAMGWTTYADLQTWQKRPLAGLPGVSPAVQRVRAHALAKRGDYQKATQVIKDEAFTNWRLWNRPEAEYFSPQSDESFAWIGKRYIEPALGEVRCHLMEFGVASTCEFERVLEAFEDAAAGANLANFWLTRGHALEKTAVRRGFTPVSSRPLLMRALSARMDDRADANTFFSFADCDVY